MVLGGAAKGRREDKKANKKGAVTFGMNAIVTEGLVPADSDEPEAVLKVGQAVQVQVF